MQPLAFELARQLLRWIGVYLVAAGLPEPIAQLVAHPDVVAWVAGLITYAVAEAFWLMAKARGWVRSRVGYRR